MVKLYTDQLVITSLVSSFKNKRFMVDIGSLVDMLPWDVFQRMGIDRDWVRPVRTSLVRLAGQRVKSMDAIHLTLTMGEKPRCNRVDTN